MMDGGSGWMMLWMLLWTLVVVAILAGAIYGAVKLAQPRQNSTDAAREVLRQRFAAGAIDEDEYTSRLTRLAR